MADQGAELLALVYESPDVDDHRLVYADWLQANGDPRGEFIMLQFKCASGVASADDRRRERALMRAHGATWLGRLSGSLDLDSVEFCKGFLASATALPHDPERLRAVRDAPEWATLEALAAPAEVLRLPGLRSLRSIGPVSPQSLIDLRAGACQLPRVAEARLTLDVWTPEHLAAICAALPELRRLELSWPDAYSASWNDFQPDLFASLLRAETASTLQSLVIRKHVLMSYRRWRDFTEARPDLHAWAQLARSCTNRVDAIHLEPCRGWRFTIERADDDSSWSLTIDWYPINASADIKTLELAVGLVRRSDFAGARVRIHDFARPQHPQQLRRVLSGIRPLAIERVSGSSTA